MFYKKSGLPEESEIVMCTVTSVQSHSVFVRMEEYSITGMIHISEISPGRIRNIRDYVKEGKVIICKVLRVHRDRGHVDLSLRRVSEGQRREKQNQLKFEQKAEKIVDTVARQLKKKPEELYKSFVPKVLEEYEYLYLLFDEFNNGDAKISDYLTDAKAVKLMEEVITQRMKPAQLQMGGEIVMSSYAPDGVDRIKKILSGIKKSDNDSEIHYLGAGRYGLSITTTDYKTGEDILKGIVSGLEKECGKQDVDFSFEKTEK